MARQKKKKSTTKIHTPWRENLECFAGAIVMALILKFFVIEAYKIPTGSMQPTLMGDEGSGVLDRILVDKLSYVFRDPARWEIVVFKYPLDLSKNYVKRLIGLPGERLAVADGNLWRSTDGTASSLRGEWEILQKPKRGSGATLETTLRRGTPSRKLLPENQTSASVTDQYRIELPRSTERMGLS